MNFEEQNNNRQDDMQEDMDVVLEQPTEESEVVEPAENPESEQEETVEIPVLDEQKKKKEPKKKKTWQQEVLEWIYCLGIAALVAFLLITFVGQIVDVSGSSMEPTLQDGDKLILYKLGYTPKKGDVVVLEPKGDTKLYIKRVIGTPGDTVEAKLDETKLVELPNGAQELVDCYAVYVNGVKLDEPYIYEQIQNNIGGDHRGSLRQAQVVPEGHVFVLGDNRNNSHDSRNESIVGMVSYESIKGKAIFRIWPLNKIGPVH